MAVNVTGTSLIPGSLECKFGDTTVPATKIDDTKVTCVAPRYNSTVPISNKAVNVSILFNRKPLAQDLVSFQYVDCQPLSTCSLCRNPVFTPESQYCGWCLGDSECSVDYVCITPAGNTTIYWQPNGCPSITRVVPNIGSISGGDQITILGDLFINSQSIRVFFGDKEGENVTVQNSTHIVCNSPSHLEGSVDVTIYLGNDSYATNNFPFNYIDFGIPNTTLSTTTTSGSPVVSDPKDNTMLIALVVGVGGVGLIIIITVVAIAIRTRHKTVQIKLKDPKYDQIHSLIG